MRVDIWSDIVCPWCYIGKRRFEKALAGFEHRDRVQVVHRSFQLHPNLPRGSVVLRDDMLMRKYNLTAAQVREMHRRLEQTAAQDGLAYHLDNGVTGNTMDAHRLVHLAQTHGRQSEVLERFFRASFTEGRSVFEANQLTALAVEAGLPEEDVHRVLESGAYADAVQADYNEARAFGCTGVPFFVFAQLYRLSGAHPVDTVSAALTRAWNEMHAFQKRQ